MAAVRTTWDGASDRYSHSILCLWLVQPLELCFFIVQPLQF